MSSINIVFTTIKCLLLVSITLTVNSTASNCKCDNPIIIAKENIDAVMETNVISTFKNVTNDSAREKLQELTVTRRICDQLAAAESAAIVNATVNATLQSDWKGDVWCKLVHMLLGEPQDYSCDVNATNQTISFLRTFCIAEMMATHYNYAFPNKNVVYTSGIIATGNPLMIMC